jgi:hypothetical protein
MTTPTVIKHALTHPTTSVTLRKAGDPMIIRTPRLYLVEANGGDSLVTVNLSKDMGVCSGCAQMPGQPTGRPLYRSTDRSGWTTYMCPSHASQWAVVR